jgi:RimJ/RimL family protein N-acetyltransferase
LHFRKAADQDRLMDFVAPAPAERIVVRDLLMRRWSRADAPALHAAITESYDHLHPWVSWAARPSTLADQHAFIDLMIEQWDTGQTLSYGIFDRSETRLLGGAGIYERTGTCAGDIAGSYNLVGLQPDKRDAPAKSGIRMIWAMTTADPKSFLRHIVE